MPIRHRPASCDHFSEVPTLIQLWLLRLLVPLGGYREFIYEHGFHNDGFAETIGLGKWVDPSAEDFNPKAVRVELRKLHAKAERKLRHVKAPSEITENIKRLARLVGLCDTDCRILEFAVLIHSERLLDDTADWLGNLSSVKVYHALSLLLDIPKAKIRKSLSPHGILPRSGLLSVDRNGTSVLRSKLDLLSEHFADLILSSADPVALLRDTVAPSGPPELTLADYGHIDRSLSVLVPYLRHACETRRLGVNIFVYGAPGTGKSQLAKVLAADLGCELFEVAAEDEDGDPVDSVRRLRAFRAAQSFFAQRRAPILFDEAEDVFNDGDRFFGRRSTAQIRKGWINRTLEDNPVPALWLLISVDCLNPAFVRRFDMMIEPPIPPKRQREQIVRAASGDALTEQSVGRIADAEQLAPAVIARAISVVCSVQDELPVGEASRAIEHLVSNILQAQGHPALRRDNPARLPECYDPAFINASAELGNIANGIARTRSARLCLYGPPGTGKTAFARWLADRLDVPLHVKRASDLLSMWVGGTEQNIAGAFREAEQDDAPLLIDEVDGFLQDRCGAQQAWEVTAVNELLTQMESFAGILIASTNLMTGLDQAALRRFDLKVIFDFLKPEQGLATAAKTLRGLRDRVSRNANENAARKTGHAHARRLCGCRPTTPVPIDSVGLGHDRRARSGVRRQRRLQIADRVHISSERRR